MNRIVKSNSDIVRAGLILLCTLVMASNAFAGGQYFIEGIVTCESNGMPIAGVDVLVTNLPNQDEQAHAVTDEDGHYEVLIFLNDPPKYQLTLTMPDGSPPYTTEPINWYSKDGITSIPMDCERECQECKGKVTRLTLQYLGSELNANILVTQKHEVIAFDGVVAPGGQFTFYGQEDDLTLGTEILVYVCTGDGEDDCVLNTKIHTSCSQPIGPGMTFGDFLVIEGESKDGGLLCPAEQDCGCDGKVTVLEFALLGSSDKYIEIYQKKVKDPIFASVDSGGNPVEVSPGEPFTVTGQDKKGTMGTEITIYIDGEETKLHTSCSQPIGPGMVVGGLLEIVKGYSLKGGMLCDVVTPPPSDDCGCDGKVTDLTLRYTGPAGAAITVLQKKDNAIVFSEAVEAGGTFSFSGTEKNGTLGTDIYLYVDGFENTKIHTSCSKPIGPGLVSGDFEILAGSSLNGGVLCPVEGNQDDDEPSPKPKKPKKEKKPKKKK